MLVSSWKEPFTPPLNWEAPDYSSPQKAFYRQHEIHVDEFGFGTVEKPLFAAIRHIVDGEVVDERRFPTWKKAIRHLRGG